MGGRRARRGIGDRGVQFTIRSRSMRFFQVVLIATALLMTGSGCAQGQSSTGASMPYTLLDDQASQLRADFNRNLGSVRLVFVVDPICPGCLRGLADMNRDLLAGTSDPRLRTFVVHEPVLGVAQYAPWLRSSGGKDVRKAAELLHNPNVRHYWNASGAFGRLLSQAVGLKNGDKQVYAWDVWLLYGPEAKWAGTDPPQPRLLMHQLGALRDSKEFPYLDSRVFAEQVHTLLAQLPPSSATAVVAGQDHQ
jgi:hypothetical protein